jgi:exonuclease III
MSHWKLDGSVYLKVLSIELNVTASMFQLTMMFYVLMELMFSHSRMATCVNNSNTKEQFVIKSYNCRGFNSSKKQYIRTVLTGCDMLFLQEHWLAEPQLAVLGDVNSDFVYTAVSGFDNSDVLIGRPYGGCDILWRATLSAIVTPIATGSMRLCAVSMCAENYKILVINVYMPYEDGDDKADEFAEQLSIIEYIISQHSDSHVIVGGDFNVDFARNWLHTTLLCSFCDNVNLNLGVNHESCIIDFSYNFNMTRFSIVDHFLLSGTLFDESITNITVSHDIDNTSDHDPIMLKMSLNVIYIGGMDIIHSPRVSWAKANCDNIKNY